MLEAQPRPLDESGRVGVRPEGAGATLIAPVSVDSPFQPSQPPRRIMGCGLGGGKDGERRKLPTYSAARLVMLASQGEYLFGTVISQARTLRVTLQVDQSPRSPRGRIAAQTRP